MCRITIYIYGCWCTSRYNSWRLTWDILAAEAFIIWWLPPYMCYYSSTDDPHSCVSFTAYIQWCSLQCMCCHATFLYMDLSLEYGPLYICCVTTYSSYYQHVFLAHDSGWQHRFQQAHCLYVWTSFTVSGFLFNTMSWCMLVCSDTHPNFVGRWYTYCMIGSLCRTTQWGDVCQTNRWITPNQTAAM